MQFLSENRLSGCQIYGRLGLKKNRFLKNRTRTESEQNFGFPHIL